MRIINSVKYKHMKKIFVLLLTVLVCGILYKITLAQDTEPPLGLPEIGDETQTVTADSISVTPTVTYTYRATRTATTQEAIDDAEVGTEIVMLITFSLVGGMGIFVLKKYFDLKRYNL